MAHPLQTDNGNVLTQTCEFGQSVISTNIGTVYRLCVIWPSKSINRGENTGTARESVTVDH